MYNRNSYVICYSSYFIGVSKRRRFLETVPVWKGVPNPKDGVLVGRRSNEEARDQGVGFRNVII